MMWLITGDPDWYEQEVGKLLPRYGISALPRPVWEGKWAVGSKKYEWFFFTADSKEQKIYEVSNCFVIDPCNCRLTCKSLAVSLRPTRFNIQKFYMVLALQWAFCRISKQRAVSALYSINLLVFITVVGSVYRVVRADSLYKVDYVSSLKF
jgi:hypothetical protein